MKKKSLSIVKVVFPIYFAQIQISAQETIDNQNVVFILADDLTYKSVSSYGNQQVRTPNLDRLSQNGIRFTNNFCNSPICSASRQSILTGKYPPSTGVTLLFTPFNDKRNETIAEHLKKQGFVTGLFGKTHFNSWIWGEEYQNLPKYGFDTIVESTQHKNWLNSRQRKPLPEGLNFYDRQSNKSNDTWNTKNLPHSVYDDESEGTFTAQKAIEFIEQHKDKRFCVWLSFYQPHAPFYYPVEFAGRFNSADIQLPTGSPEDDRWIPAIFRDFTNEQKKNVIAAYYTSVEYLDKNIGLVLDALNVMSLDKNTLIVFVSDNGYLLYDHKRFEKHTMWDYSVKVPMIISGPNIPKGIVLDAITEAIDIVPTTCELLKVPQMKQAQGLSFHDLLTGKKKDHKPFAFSVFLEDNILMISSKEWKYVFTTGKRDLGLEYSTKYGAPGITHFLYNLALDPGETENLSGKISNQEMLRNLQMELLNWCINTWPDANDLPDNLTIEGKLAWFAEPRDIGAEYGGKALRLFNAK